MKNWDDFENFAQNIITPFMDSSGQTTGRLEGAHHLFDLLPKLIQSNVLSETRQRFSHLTIIFFPSERNDFYVSIVPPGPMLSGSGDYFVVAVHKGLGSDDGIIKQLKFHFQELDDLVQVVEEYCLNL